MYYMCMVVCSRVVDENTLASWSIERFYLWWDPDRGLCGSSFTLYALFLLDPCNVAMISAHTRSYSNFLVMKIDTHNDLHIQNFPPWMFPRITASISKARSTAVTRPFANFTGEKSEKRLVVRTQIACYDSWKPPFSSFAGALSRKRLLTALLWATSLSKSWVSSFCAWAALRVTSWTVSCWPSCSIQTKSPYRRGTAGEHDSRLFTLYTSLL